MDPCCKNCKFYFNLNSWTTVCRRYPPASFNYNKTYCYPSISGQNWCGEHCYGGLKTEYKYTAEMIAYDGIITKFESEIFISDDISDHNAVKKIYDYAEKKYAGLKHIRVFKRNIGEAWRGVNAG